MKLFSTQDVYKEIRRIRQNITDIMANMTLLEEMQHKISYEEFEKSWKCFGLPAKIHKRREKCTKELVNVEQKLSEDLVS